MDRDGGPWMAFGAPTRLRIPRLVVNPSARNACAVEGG